MFKLFLIFFLLVYGYNLVQAGNGIDLNRRNAVYFEAGGSGFLGSVNYERIFYIKDKPRFCGRIGFAIHPDAIRGVSDVKTFFLAPLGASFLAGDEKDFFEVGLSWTHDFNPYKAYIDYGNVNYEVETYHDDYYFIYLGYRYHSKSGFLFRAAVTPAFSYRTDTHRTAGESSAKKLEATIWAGVSLGYVF